MQCHFPTDDVLLPSGDIRDQVVQNRTKILMFLGHQISDLVRDIHRQIQLEWGSEINLGDIYHTYIINGFLQPKSNNTTLT